MFLRHGGNHHHPMRSQFLCRGEFPVISSYMMLHVTFALVLSCPSALLNAWTEITNVRVVMLQQSEISSYEIVIWKSYWNSYKRRRNLRQSMCIWPILLLGFIIVFLCFLTHIVWMVENTLKGWSVVVKRRPVFYPKNPTVTIISHR